MAPIDPRTASVQRKYNRIAGIYDLLEAPMEARMFNQWRRRIWQQARGRVLEIGVGTGRNFDYYPTGIYASAIDISDRMLQRAWQRRQQLGLPVDIQWMDAQDLHFPDNTFDTVITTCVFCTVPDPVRGLQEARRVCRPDGQLIMLEHVRSRDPWIGLAMEALNPLIHLALGTNINRDTVANLARAGLQVDQVTPLWRDILLEIKASP